MPPLYPYGAAPPSYRPLPAAPALSSASPAAPPTRSDGRAIAALVLGVLSMTCLGFLAGIPAIVIGAMSRREIDRSQGVLSGRGIAAGGIVTGLFGTGLSMIAVVALLSGVVESVNAPAPRTESPLRVPVAAGTRSYGSLDVVDLDTKSPLKTQLSEIARSATSKNHIVMLQTYVRTSKECAEVAAALPDTRMQRALTNVTLVRVDIDAFEDELKALRVETDSAPWFYKLDANARVTDAISADEWDANVPENMAPILGPFAKGALGARRSPSPVGTAL